MFQLANVCALTKDFRQFLSSGRHDKIVGDRDVCLSGGQKAQINLVRAVVTSQ